MTDSELFLLQKNKNKLEYKKICRISILKLLKQKEVFSFPFMNTATNNKY